MLNLKRSGCHPVAPHPHPPPTTLVKQLKYYIKPTKQRIVGTVERY